LERGCHPEMPEPSRWLGSPRRRLHYALYERPVEEAPAPGQKEE